MKKITFLLILLLSSIQPLFAQVTIGDTEIEGNVNYNQNAPFSPMQFFSYAQTIYLASEVNATGSITDISWLFHGGISALSNTQIDVYIGKTSKTSFSTNLDWIPVSSLTKVYTGGIEVLSYKSWVTITLTTPFPYDGNDNLVIAVNETKSGKDDNTFFYNSPVSTSRSLAASNTSAIDPANPNTVSSHLRLLRSAIPKVIFEGISKRCDIPEDLIAMDITSSSATIDWNSATTPGFGTDYYISTSNLQPNNITTATGSVTSTVVNVNGLSPDTTYYVWAKNKCTETTASSWSQMLTFRTECIATSLISENFETITPPNLPTCWSKIIRGAAKSDASNYIKTEIRTNETQYRLGSPTSIYFKNDGNNLATINIDDMILVSPKLDNIDSGTYRLKFKAKYLSFDLIKGALQIGTLNNNTATAQFTPIESFTLTTDSKDYILNFNNYFGSDTYIGIRLNTPYPSSNVYLDDIIWEPAPSCSDVTNIVIDSKSTTTANISWSSESGSIGWQVAVDLATGTTSANNLDQKDTPTPSITIDKLIANTNYKFWVRTVCNNAYGNWIGPIYLKTECEATTSFSEKFDSAVTPPNLPSCWSSIVRGNDLNNNDFIKTEHFNSQSSPNNIILGSSKADSNKDIILVSPRLSNIASLGYRLKFYAKYNGPTTDPNLQLVLLDGNTNTANYILHSVVTVTNEYKEFIINFDSYTGTNSYIGFKMNSSYPSFTSMFLDNIVWEPIPFCSDVTDIKIPRLNENSATLTWKANSDHTGWKVVYSEDLDSDPNALEEKTTAENSIKLDNLKENTVYYAWVKSDCHDLSGSWMTPVTFKTACAPVATFYEDFDTTSALSSICWSSILRGSSLSNKAQVKIAPTSPKAGSDPNSVNMFNDSSANEDDLILVSPNLSTLSEGKYRLRFSTSKLAENPDLALEYGTLSSNNKDAIFNKLGEVAISGTFSQQSIPFNNYTGTDTFIGIRMKATTKTQVNIDDLNWDLIPNCADLTNVAINKTTENSVSVSWTKPDTDTKYEIAKSLASENYPNTSNIVSSDTNSGTLINLTENTAYKIWVRTVCGDEKGAWTNPVKFTTPCSPVAEFHQNFNTLANSVFPDCWNKIIRGNNVLGAADINTFEKSLLFNFNNSDVSSEFILVSPNLSNLKSGINHLSFYCDAFYGCTLEIGTLNSNTNSAAFNVLKTINVPAKIKTPITVFDEFKNYTGNDTFIGIRVVSGAYHNVNIDDLHWDDTTALPLLGNEEFNLADLNFYPNPVKDILNINYRNNINNITVYNILGQELLSKPANSNNTNIDLSNLSNGTYLVKIVSENGIHNLKILKK